MRIKPAYFDSLFWDLSTILLKRAPSLEISWSERRAHWHRLGKRWYYENNSDLQVKRDENKDWWQFLLIWSSAINKYLIRWISLYLYFIISKPFIYFKTLSYTKYHLIFSKKPLRKRSFVLFGIITPLEMRKMKVREKW